MNLKPCKITFQMATPMVVGQSPIHLDDVLTYQQVMRQDGDQALDRSVDEMKFIELPLLKLGSEDEPFYACSVGMPNPNRVSYHRTFYTKKWHGETEGVFKIDADFEPKFTAKVDKGRSWSKEYCETLWLCHTDTITFYANGDVDQIRDLVEGITNLGKKRSQGFGEVASVQVEELAVTNQNGKETIWQNGEVVRNIPISYLTEAERKQYASEMDFTGHYAPYRNKRNFSLCITPSLSVWKPMEKQTSLIAEEVDEEEMIDLF